MNHSLTIVAVCFLGALWTPQGSSAEKKKSPTKAPESYPVGVGKETRITAPEGKKMDVQWTPNGAMPIIPEGSILHITLIQNGTKNTAMFDLNYVGSVGDGIVFAHPITGPVVWVKGERLFFPDMRLVTSKVPISRAVLSDKELVEAWKASLSSDVSKNVLQVLLKATDAKGPINKSVLKLIRQVGLFPHPAVDEFLKTLESSRSAEVSEAAKSALSVRIDAMKLFNGSKPE